MDQGLYNKWTEPRGDHGTLIGNWYEERALHDATGYTRTRPFEVDKTMKSVSDRRCLHHSENRDFPNVRESIARSSFSPLQTHWPDKFYHRTSIEKRTANKKLQKAAEAAASATAKEQRAPSPYETAPNQNTVPAQQRRARYAMPITRYGPGSVPPPDLELKL